MTDPDIERMARKLEKKLDGAKDRTLLKARTGKLASATTINPNPRAGAVRNKIWVRIGATKANPAGRSQQQAWNYGKVSTRKADLAVIVDYDENGDLYVVRADNQDADASGVPSGFYNGDPLPAEFNDTALPFANILDIKPYYGGSGLLLRARPGLLPGGAWWPDTSRLDLTADITATTGMTAYVVAGIDLTTGAWVTDTTSDHGIMLPWPANAADVATMLASWSGVFPVAAVPIANGATTFTNSDIVDLRTWGTDGGSGMAFSDDDISNPPASGELASAFPSATAPGDSGLLDDDGTSTSDYLTLWNGNRWFYTALAKALQVSVNLVFEGDSLTVGYPGTVPNSYPAQLNALLTELSPRPYFNNAVSGSTTAQILARTAAVDTAYDADYDLNIAVLWAGTAEFLNTAHTGAQAYADITTWVQARQALGFRVVVLTIMDINAALEVSEPTYEARRADLNPLIIANAAGADAVIDASTATHLTDASNTTYFVDGLHLTTTGYGVVAALVKPVLLALWNAAIGIEHLSRLTGYADTKAHVEAAGADLSEVRFAYATDTDELGIYFGGVWHWASASVFYQTVRVNSVDATQRSAINLLDGIGISLSGADDSGDDETVIVPNLNLPSLTEDTSPTSADYVLTYDSSASAHKKALIGNLPITPRLLFSQIEDKTIANTTAEVSLLGTGRGASAVAAGTLQVGSRLHFRLRGYLSDTGTPNLTERITLGGTEIITTGAFALPSSVTDVGWLLDVDVDVRATGASGSVVASGTLTYNGTPRMIVNKNAVTVDTTGPLTFLPLATWGTASSSNTITTQEAFVEHWVAPQISTGAAGFLLESGSALLLETGDKMLLEG